MDTPWVQFWATNLYTSNFVSLNKIFFLLLTLSITFLPNFNLPPSLLTTPCQCFLYIIIIFIIIVALPCGWRGCIAVCWSLNVSVFFEHLKKFWLNFIFLLFWIFCLQQFPCIHPPPDIYPLFQWRFGNPFIRWSHTFTPEMPQRLLDISTALNDFFTNKLQQLVFIKYKKEKTLDINNINTK